MPARGRKSRGREPWRELLNAISNYVVTAVEPLFGAQLQPAIAAVPGGGGTIARAEAADPSVLLPGFTSPVRLRRRTATRKETAPRAATDTEQAELIAIIHAAQAGSTEAFGSLYDRYAELVFRYVYYRVGSHQLAEDVVSETFLRALRRLDSFTWQGRDFGAWLVTIARNIVADHFKSSRYRLEVTTADMLDSDRVEESPEHTVLRSFTNVALIQAVKELGPEQQECIVLRFLQGLSVAETARIMGRNEGAVKALQYRAVRALARLLPDDVR